MCPVDLSVEWTWDVHEIRPMVRAYPFLAGIGQAEKEEELKGLVRRNVTPGGYRRRKRRFQFFKEKC